MDIFGFLECEFRFLNPDFDNVHDGSCLLKTALKSVGRRRNRCIGGRKL